MAGSAVSAEVTRLYRQRLADISQQAERAVVRAWSLVDLQDIDGTFLPALDLMEAAVTAAQREAVRLADIYLATFLTSELGEPVSPTGIDPAPFVGVTRDGRPIRRVLALAPVSAKLAAGNGRTLRSVGLAGLARVVRAARTESVDAGRRAQDTLTRDDPRTSGWQRVASGDPCGACLGMAGARFSDGHLFEIHGACRCTAEPVVVGVRQTHPPASGEQIFGEMSSAQARDLYGEKATLLEEGSIVPADLVATSEARDWGPMLHEAPLAKLSSG